MGVFSYPIEVGNPEGTRFERLDAVVDTGAMYSQVPASTLRGLGVVPLRRMRLRLADGRVVERDLGRTWMAVDGQREVTLVIFGEEGAETLLGAYTLEGLSLAADPVHQQLVPAVQYLL